MNVHVLKFEAAHLIVEVRSELPEVVVALEAMWRPAVVAHDQKPELSYQVDADGRVRREERSVGLEVDRARPVPLIEGDILRNLSEKTKTSTVLHAGAVLLRGRLYLLVGEANSGKSTMTRAALRQGAKYLTDDTLVVDGPRYAGLARSLHFDSFPIDEERELPAYLLDCDLESYRFVARDGGIWVTPIWHGDFETVRDCQPSEGDVILVSLERGGDEMIAALSPLERAAALLGATIGPREPSLGLIPEGPSFRLTWDRDPERGFSDLLTRVELGLN